MTKTAKVKKQLKIQSVSISEASTIYRAIYHPLRLKITELIHKAGTINVSKLNMKLKTDKSLLSQQLKILRDVNILSTEREGKQIFYSINYKHLSKIAKAARDIAPIPQHKQHELSVKAINTPGKKASQEAKPVRFTSNELVVIKMICDQNTSEEIGEKLKLSKRTVEDYRSRIIEKMKMKNTAGLVVYAMRTGMFK